MSWFNHSGFSTFVDFSRDHARDPESGLLLTQLNPLQLESVRRRFPHLRQHAPEPKPVIDAFSVYTPPPRDRGWYFKTSRQSSALLHDQAPVRHTPTKPAVRRYHQSDRALAASYHEAGHATLSLMLGLRVPSATIVPGNGSDGHTIIESTDNRGVNCCIDLAGQIADEMSGVPMSSDNYKTDNKNWPVAMRAELKPMVRQYLAKAWGAVDEIAKQLLLRETLDEFQIKCAYVTGLRKWRAKLGVPATGNDTKAAPKAGRSKRSYDFSNPEDVRAFNIRMGRDPNSEPIGYTQGIILNGGTR
jgi:hypothetical protein